MWAGKDQHLLVWDDGGKLRISVSDATREFYLTMLANSHSPQEKALGDSALMHEQVSPLA